MMEGISGARISMRPILPFMMAVYHDRDGFHASNHARKEPSLSLPQFSLPNHCPGAGISGALSPVQHVVFAMSP
jgi:hypothetical protein